MPRLRFEGTDVDCDRDETVLDALLRNDLNVAHACRNGSCQSCLLRCERGTPGLAAQKGVKESLRAQGFFLACQCKPHDDMVLSSGEAVGLFCKAQIASRSPLCATTSQFTLRPAAPFTYQAGQFVHLRRADGLVRSYSLASLPNEEGLIELHITRHDEGQMSRWLHDECEPGTTLELRGPFGDCTYAPGRPDQKILMVGTGSGLSPLFGILRAARENRHAGEIHLYHGSLSTDGLYFVEKLRKLAAQWENFSYHPCADECTDAQIRASRADLAAFADHPNLTDWRLYLAGHPGMVRSAKKNGFLAGASISDILADPFDVAV